MQNLISTIINILGLKGGATGATGATGNGGFEKGIQHGLMFGGGNFKGAPSKALDSQLGMSALGQYNDMSQPQQNFSGMNQAMNFAQMQRPGGPIIQQQQQTNAYLQALLQAMYGNRQ